MTLSINLYLNAFALHTKYLNDKILPFSNLKAVKTFIKHFPSQIKTKSKSSGLESEVLVLFGVLNFGNLKEKKMDN